MYARIEEYERNFHYNDLEDEKFQLDLLKKKMGNESFFTKAREDLRGSSPEFLFNDIDGISLDEQIGRTFVQIVKLETKSIYFGIRGKAVYLSYDQKEWKRIFRSQRSHSRMWAFPFLNKLYIFEGGSKGVYITVKDGKVLSIQKFNLDYCIYDIVSVNCNNGVLIADKHHIYYDPRFSGLGISTRKNQMMLIYKVRTEQIKRLAYDDLSRVLIIFTQKGAIGYIMFDHNLNVEASFMRHKYLGKKSCPMIDMLYLKKLNVFLFMDQAWRLYAVKGVNTLLYSRQRIFKIKKSSIYPVELFLSEFNGNIYAYDSNQNLAKHFSLMTVVKLVSNAVYEERERYLK